MPWRGRSPDTAAPSSMTPGADPAAPGDVGRRGARRRWWIWAGVSAAALVVVVGLLAPRGERPPPAGRDAPRFTLPRLDDPSRTVSLDPGRRPVVVNFWASWCAPCRREMPALEAVSSRLVGRVDFLGVNHQDGRRAALDLVAETGISYPSGYDPDGRVARDLAVFGMPTTLFVDGTGRIVDRRTGELSRAELEKAIERAFGIRF